MTIATQIGARVKAVAANFARQGDIPRDNVQKAIEYVHATLLAAINASNMTLKTPQYLVAQSSSDLDNERVATDTPTVAWDHGTAAQAKANVPDKAITDAKLRDSAALSVVGRAANSVGNPADIAAGANDRLLTRIANALGFTQLTPGMFPSTLLDTDGTLSANSDTRIATQKATKTYVDQIVAAQDAMVFKGVIDCSANPNYPAADRGWTYRVSVAGKIGGASGPNVEVGDILLCQTDGAASGNYATVGLQWAIIQANLDGAVIGPASVTDENPSVFDGATGKLIKQLTYAAFLAKLAAFTGDSGSGGVKGLVPAPSSGDAAANKVLGAGGGWVAQSGGSAAFLGLTNHSLAVSAAGGALTIALKDSAGNDPSSGSPVVGNFRNATPATGSWTQLSVTSALSLLVSSGSTLGVTSSTAFKLWVVLFNDGGTPRLGVINCANATNIFPLNEGAVASSTAEGGAGAADSAGVFYTGTAVAAKAYLIVGYVEWSSSGLTAGTWTTTNKLYEQSFGPGIKKPGDDVQHVIATTTTGVSSHTSSSYTSALSASITPTSAANRVRVAASGTQRSSPNANPVFVTLFRGTTAGTKISSRSMPCVNIGDTIGTAALNALDAPNTAGSQAYTVGLASDGTRAAFLFHTGDTASYGELLLTEIMT